MNEQFLKALISARFILAPLILMTFMFSGCKTEKSKTPADTPQQTNTAYTADGITAVNGSKVKVNYIGKLDADKIFDQSSADKPFEFTVGSGQVIKGFNMAVLGMKTGEEKTVTVKASDAYGERDPSKVTSFPLSSLPKDLSPEKGKIIKLKSNDGDVISAMILDVTANEIMVDVNHLLAGKDLIFTIKLLSVE